MDLGETYVLGRVMVECSGEYETSSMGVPVSRSTIFFCSPVPLEAGPTSLQGFAHAEKDCMDCREVGKRCLRFLSARDHIMPMPEVRRWKSSLFLADVLGSQSLLCDIFTGSPFRDISEGCTRILHPFENDRLSFLRGFEEESLLPRFEASTLPVRDRLMVSKHGKAEPASKEEPTVMKGSSGSASAEADPAGSSPDTPSPKRETSEPQSTQSTTHRCEQCGMTFTRKYHLGTHEKAVHEKDRSFACNQCPARFVTRSNLLRHVKSVHEKERKYACPRCSFACNRRSDLARHRRLVHREET